MLVAPAVTVRVRIPSHRPCQDVPDRIVRVAHRRVIPRVRLPRQTVQVVVGILVVDPPQTVRHLLHVSRLRVPVRTSLQIVRRLAARVRRHDPHQSRRPRIVCVVRRRPVPVMALPDLPRRLVSLVPGVLLPVRQPTQRKQKPGARVIRLSRLVSVRSLFWSHENFRRNSFRWHRWVMCQTYPGR